MPSTPSCIAVVTATPQSSQSLLSHKASSKPRRHNGTRQPNATLRETSWSRRSGCFTKGTKPAQSRSRLCQNRPRSSPSSFSHAQASRGNYILMSH
ncbi:hypothetical protein CEP54_006920 [Fusarium duplospermum]|uniref:Uncharacterized protein n=1 Tax=Fusarium duplospermum TaxID=1325734 RepID=A0A428Q4R5_9HYPO|nr:hypothetical protein CEP54_006920 [Fusarium duplospermum]